MKAKNNIFISCVVDSIFNMLKENNYNIPIQYIKDVTVDLLKIANDISVKYRGYDIIRDEIFPSSVYYPDDIVCTEMNNEVTKNLMLKLTKDRYNLGLIEDGDVINVAAIFIRGFAEELKNSYNYDIGW